ncbi:hypothetical protein [Frankia sp. CcWB3]
MSSIPRDTKESSDGHPPHLAPLSAARVPAARDAPGAHPRPRLEPELAEQLDELSRCLIRMDAVMMMLEADLDRRALALAELVDPFPDLPPADLAPADPLTGGAPGSGWPARRAGRRGDAR